MVATFADMEYRRLGKSGLQVSALSYGSWLTFGNQIDEDLASRLMHKAYDSGVNFFDNAETYAAGRSEEVMGNILARSGWDRTSYLVSSKVFWGGTKPNQKGLSRKHVIEACHAALRRLQVDYLDLYYCHRPDINTPMEETVRAMSDLITQGKVLYWGTSEWRAEEIMEAYAVARQYNLVPPVVEQPQYNLFVREKVERDYVKLYDTIGLGTTIWSPLASGLLTGKYLEGIPDDSRAAKVNTPDYQWLYERFAGAEGQRRNQKAGELKKIADELGVSLTHLSLAWCLKNPHVSSVILGASRVEQLEDNLACLPVVAMLDDSIMSRIEAIVENKPVFPTY